MQPHQDIDTLSLTKHDNFDSLQLFEGSIRIRPPKKPYGSMETLPFIDLKPDIDSPEQTGPNLEKMTNFFTIKNLKLIEKKCEDLIRSHVEIDSKLSELDPANIKLLLGSLDTKLNEFNQNLISSFDSTNERLTNIEKSVVNLEAKLTSLSDLVEKNYFIPSESLQEPSNKISDLRNNIFSNLVLFNSTEKEKKKSNDEDKVFDYSSQHETFISNIENRIKNLEELISKNESQFDKVIEIITKVNSNSREVEAKMYESSNLCNENINELKEKLNSLINLSSDAFKTIKEKYDVAQGNSIGEVCRFEKVNAEVHQSKCENYKGQGQTVPKENYKGENINIAQEVFDSFNLAYSEFSMLTS